LEDKGGGTQFIFNIFPVHIKSMFQMVLKALQQNRGRSFLTMLGIIIGISSVIIILSVGASAQDLILQQIKSIGSNLIVVFPGASEESGPPVSVLGINVTTLKNHDIEALLDKNRVRNILAATGYVRGVGTVASGGESMEGTFLGVNYSYPEVESSEIENGRFFTQEDEKSMSRYAVLGSQVKIDLFGDQDPIGAKIKIKKETFEVIGTVKSRGPSGFQNPDGYVFVPITTAQNILLGIDNLSFLRMKVVDELHMDEAIEEVRQTLREEHNLRKNDVDDFTIRTSAQALGALMTITDAMKFFLATIAAISLLVGGIGIMNIMFVAITERTREIGLRKALGAKNSDIISQFIIEAMAISLVGGIIGLIVGVSFSFLISVVINALDYQWSFIINIQSVLLSIAFSLAIGFIFGIYPAFKASKLNPIEALRYE